MITKEALLSRAIDASDALVDSLNNQSITDIAFYVGKLRTYEYMLTEDQEALLYEAEQILDAITQVESSV